MGDMAEELRELLRMAKRLRSYCGETNDPVYTDIFIRGAEALEARAHRIAVGLEKSSSGTPQGGKHSGGRPSDAKPPDAKPTSHINVVC